MRELEYTTQSVPKDKRFCTICGKVKRLHCFEGDSTHCSECREKMLHTRLNGRSIPVVLFVLLVAAFSVFLSVYTVPYCIDLFKAEAAVRDKRLADACTVYASAVSSVSDRSAAMLSAWRKDTDVPNVQSDKSFFEAGTRTWVRYLDTYAALYSEYEAATLAQNSLNADEIEKVPAIARLNEAQEAYSGMIVFMQLLETTYPFEPKEEMPYDEIMAELTKHADESDSRYVKGYVEYYKGSVTQYYKPDDLDASKVYFEKMLEYLPDEFMTAYTSEANAAFNAKEYAAAIEIYEKLLEKNKDYTAAYPVIAEAAFLAGDEEKLASVLDRYDENDSLRLRLEMRFALREQDLKKAAAVRARANKMLLPEAEKIFNELLAKQTIDQESRTKLLDYAEYAMWDAAFALVEGDTDEAFRIANDRAFNYVYYCAYLTNDSSVFSQSILNMTTLCASLAKDEKTAGMVAEIGSCDENTQKVIDGELTVRDVFVEGKAEIL